MGKNYLPLGQNGIENGVKVTYTGGSIYHLTGNFGTVDEFYDEKIQGGSSGAINVYRTDDEWASHSHTHYDKEGNVDYDRPADKDSADHPWTHRFDD